MLPRSVLDACESLCEPVLKIGVDHSCKREHRLSKHDYTKVDRNFLLSWWMIDSLAIPVGQASFKIFSTHETHFHGNVYNNSTLFVKRMTQLCLLWMCYIMHRCFRNLNVEKNILPETLLQSMTVTSLTTSYHASVLTFSAAWKTFEERTYDNKQISRVWKPIQ